MYYVYMMTNKYNNVLYIGVTGDIENRAWQHKAHELKGFTSKYNCEKLVYIEGYNDVKIAIEREKELKGWNRDWKDKLVNKTNPEWLDLMSAN